MELVSIWQLYTTKRVEIPSNREKDKGFLSFKHSWASDKHTSFLFIPWYNSYYPKHGYSLPNIFYPMKCILIKRKWLDGGIVRKHKGLWEVTLKGNSYSETTNLPYFIFLWSYFLLCIYICFKKYNLMGNMFDRWPFLADQCQLYFPDWVHLPNGGSNGYPFV